MPGQPQLRESALLYGDDPAALLAMVRLEQRMDGSGGWDVLLNSPADTPTQRAEHPDEQSARAELEAVYESGRALGEWTIRQSGEDHGRVANAVAVRLRSRVCAVARHSL